MVKKITGLVFVLFFLLTTWNIIAAKEIQEPKNEFNEIPYLKYSYTKQELVLAVKFRPGWGYRVLRFKFPDRLALEISFKDGPPADLDLGTKASIYEQVKLSGSFLVQDLKGRIDESGMRVTLSSHFPLDFEPVFDEEKNTLYVIIPLEIERENKKLLSPGLEYSEIILVDSVGPKKLHIIKADMSNGRYKPGIVTARDFGRSFLSVESMVKNSGAVCAVNGGYYSGDGNHQGTIIRDMELLSYPKFNRPVFARTTDGKLHIGILPIHGVLLGPSDMAFSFEAVDTNPKKGEVVLLTPGHPSRISENLPGSKIIIKDYVVEKVTTEAVNDKKGKYILWSPEFRDDFKQLQPGDNVQVEFFLGISDIEIDFALGAGPMLVNGGKVNIGKDNDFRNDVMYGRAPRTGVGLTKDGELLLVVLEGRNPFVSMGGSLREFAEIMIKYGAVVAMNLDGGGSSAMVVYDDKVGQTPGYTKGITNSLAIFDIMDSRRGIF